MGEQIEGAGISWTHYTFNMWWGCWKIADECKNCYADSTDRRYGGEHWGRTAPRRFFGESHWRQLAKWNAKAERDGERRRVFVGSMMDWAERHVDLEIRRQQDAFRGRLWTEIKRCTWLDFLLLTKRPEDAAELLPWMHIESEERPYPNLWLGVSCGSRASLPKIRTLREIPAAVRFVSGEPLLEHVTREEWAQAFATRESLGPVHWLIIGDESGANARAAQVDWVRSAREAALASSVAFHFKQWANRVAPAGIKDPSGATDEQRKGRKIHLPMLDGRQWAEFPR